MRKIFTHRFLLSRNWLGIVGICLLCYFSYHALLGERSYIRLMSLERKTEKVSFVYHDLRTERMALENKVAKLRPGSLDKDLLEERVHHVLGYYHPDETVILR